MERGGTKEVQAVRSRLMSLPCAANQGHGYVQPKLLPRARSGSMTLWQPESVFMFMASVTTRPCEPYVLNSKGCLSDSNEKYQSLSL